MACGGCAKRRAEKAAAKEARLQEKQAAQEAIRKQLTASQAQAK